MQGEDWRGTRTQMSTLQEEMYIMNVEVDIGAWMVPHRVGQISDLDGPS